MISPNPLQRVVDLGGVRALRVPHSKSDYNLAVQ